MQRKSGRYQTQPKKNQKRKILFATQVGSLQNLDQIKVREKLPQVI